MAASEGRMREFEDAFDWETKERNLWAEAGQIALIGVLIVLGILYHKYS
jgi:hypothetical protein